MKNYVAYYRVSTTRQGKSGLGIEAQKVAIKSFLKGSSPLKEFMDIESGTRKGNNRNGLKTAIKYTLDHKATLLIAKLDRLARNVSFVSQLMESGVDFIACDMPQANKFTIHIFAALAEQEADLISQRTKAALTELKFSGKSLGTPKNLTKNARLKGMAIRTQNALMNPNNRKAGALIIALRNEGKSFSTITYQLNSLGFRTRRGKEFRQTQVRRLFDRYETIAEQNDKII